MSSSKLFQPITVGGNQLQHRVVFAPTTRFRADDAHVLLPHVPEYYSQRSTVPGSLLITEATLIAAQAGGLANAPGVWSEAQIASWKKVVDVVHANGSFIFLQLWALGRAADYEELLKDGLPYVAPSAIGLSDEEHKNSPPPRAFTLSEIQEYPALYAAAASNAVHKAGFDGVEIHGANGYLIDQFTQDMSNHRTDAYGGSIENRARFTLEVIDAVVKTVGVERTAFRISPWNTYQGMRMADPKPTYAHVISKLRDQHPNLAYLNVVEPRIEGGAVTTLIEHLAEGISNDFIRDIWGDRPLISAGGYVRNTAMKAADEKGDLVAFSRLYIANPDLPYRLKNDIPLTRGDRSTYYALGSVDPKGYTDYPFAPGNPGGAVKVVA